MASDHREYLVLFCFLLTFASSIKNFIVASHNLHIFKKTSTFHKQCLQQYGSIWMAQELWLPESRLSLLHELGVNYVAKSGMEDSISGGIMRGCQYGGVSIAWTPDLNHVIKPLINYRHKRIVSVEATANPHPTLLTLHHCRSVIASSAKLHKVKKVG